MHNAQRTMHHDYPRIFIVIAAMIVICLMIGTGLADGSVTLSPGEDWVWTRGAYNTFTGEIDLSAFIGQEVTLVMGTNLKYDPEKEEKSSPVFTSVNGKRLTMMKQSASVQVTVDEAGSITRFTGSLLLPEKSRVSLLELSFKVTDAEGATLSTVYGTIESGDNAAQKNAFFIRADIQQVTLILAIAAGIVWMLAIGLRIKAKRTRETGNGD